MYGELYGWHILPFHYLLFCSSAHHLHVPFLLGEVAAQGVESGV